MSPLPLDSRALGLLSRDELDRLQDERFSAFAARQLVPNVPFYRRAFEQRGIDGSAVTSIDDWEKLGLPLVTKAMYKVDPELWIARPPAGASRTARLSDVSLDFIDVSHVEGRPAPVALTGVRGGFDESFYTEPFTAFFTGGSTGEPTPVRMTRSDREYYDLAGSRVLAAGATHLWSRGLPARAAVMYPHAIHKGWWALNGGAEKVAEYTLRSSAGGAVSTERLALHILRDGINLLYATPSFLRNRLLPELINASRATGLTASPVIVAALGGEAILPIVRTEMEERLAEIGVTELIPVNTYGSTEGRFGCFSECSPGSGYHNWNSDLVAFRLVDFRGPDDWEFVREPGRAGYVTIFPMEGNGTLLAGFMTGDRGILSDSACARCGWAVENLLKVGREQDVSAQMLVMGSVESKLKGTTVDLTDLRAELLKDEALYEIQVVVEKQVEGDAASPDVLRLRVALRDGVSADDHLTARIARRCKALSEVTPLVEYTGLQELLGTAVKFTSVLDRRPFTVI